MEFQSTRPVWGVTWRTYICIISYNISIHTPRVGRDAVSGCLKCKICPFQSTRPVWGVTVLRHCVALPMQISIHTPRVGRDQDRIRCGRHHGISIHTPRVGRDNTLYFVSAGLQISIHTPRVGRDYLHRFSAEPTTNFNPHAPCGA